MNTSSVRKTWRTYWGCGFRIGQDGRFLRLDRDSLRISRRIGKCGGAWVIFWYTNTCNWGAYGTRCERVVEGFEGAVKQRIQEVPGAKPGHRECGINFCYANKIAGVGRSVDDAAGYEPRGVRSTFSVSFSVFAGRVCVQPGGVQQRSRCAGRCYFRDDCVFPRPKVASDRGSSRRWTGRRITSS